MEPPDDRRQQGERGEPDRRVRQEGEHGAAAGLLALEQQMLVFRIARVTVPIATVAVMLLATLY